MIIRKKNLNIYLCLNLYFTKSNYVVIDNLKCIFIILLYKIKVQYIIKTVNLVINPLG